MLTRSSGSAPVIGTEPIPSIPDIAIPLFTHPPVPFNPFPEAAFPTVEFPVPQNQDQIDRSGEASETLGSWVTSNEHNRKVVSMRSLNKDQEQIGWGPTIFHNTSPISEEDASTSEEMSCVTDQALPHRWLAVEEEGEFQYDQHWSAANELLSSEDEEHPKLRTKLKGQEVFQNWSDLTAGVQIVIMTEIVSIYGTRMAPGVLGLTEGEIIDYVDLQEREATGQATEEAKTAEYNDFRFQQMLAGRLDACDSMAYIDEQFANGAVWEPATISLKKSDLKAGGRFLSTLGLKHVGMELRRYHGSDVADGYAFDRKDPEEVTEALESTVPREVPALGRKNSKAKRGSQAPELPPIEVEPNIQLMPMVKRNLLLDKVKKSQVKSRPPRKRHLDEKVPNRSSLTPSKLRMSISIDDEVGRRETSPAHEPDAGKARVARMVPRGADPSKSGEDARKTVKCIRPTRQWADAGVSRRGSKEYHMREQQSRETPLAPPKHFDLTGPDSATPLTPEGKQQARHHTFYRKPYEGPKKDQNTTSQKLTAPMAMMGTDLLRPSNSIGSSSPPQHTEAGTAFVATQQTRNIAEFANSDLRAKWAKKSKPVEKLKSSDRVMTPLPRFRSTLETVGPVPCSLPRKAPPLGAPPEILMEKTRSERKRTLSDEPFNPFDMSTPGHLSKKQKNNVRKPASKPNRLGEQEEDMEQGEMSFEMRKAGEQARTMQPQMTIGTAWNSNVGGERIGGERQDNSREERKTTGWPTFLIPKVLMDDPDL